MAPDFLSQLLDNHSAALVLYARQWCVVPEDVVQEAFLKLATQRSPPEQPVAWLYRVVRNGALSAQRSQRRRQIHEQSAAAESPTWFVPDESDELDVEAATAALATLPLEQREIIVAHLWGGLTFEQIAELTGLSSSTAHRHYTAGLMTLRDRLGVPCPTRRTIPNL